VIFVHQGDAPAGTPGLVRAEHVIGRVLAHRRTIGLPERVRAAVTALSRVLLRKAAHAIRR
jgi:hypothetical protein